MATKFRVFLREPQAHILPLFNLYILKSFRASLSLFVCLHHVSLSLAISVNFLVNESSFLIPSVAGGCLI
jgi:hypothetical protein